MFTVATMQQPVPQPPFGRGGTRKDVKKRVGEHSLSAISGIGPVKSFNKVTETGIDMQDGKW
jgi:hypothetical protein